MGDIIGGLASGTGTETSGGLTSQMDFSIVFNLIWKIIFAIMQKKNVFYGLIELFC